MYTGNAARRRRHVTALVLVAFAARTEAARGQQDVARRAFRIDASGDQLQVQVPAAGLRREYVLVTRVVSAPSGTLYADSRISDRIVYWERDGKRLLLRQRGVRAWADSADPSSKAVERQNAPPILASLAIDRDTGGVLVANVTSLFTAPPPELGPGGGIRGNIDPGRSFAASAVNRAGGVDVEAVITVLTAPPAPVTIPAWVPQPISTANTLRLHWSFVALPDVPMEPRFADRRLNFFSSSLVDYTAADGLVGERNAIWRWRLEKRDPTAAVADVIRPITFVIDPSTPRRWVPWIRRGVEAWQPAFERAGFRRAVVAVDAPPGEEPGAWSSADARYSVIRWLPSSIEDASGQQVVDPRTGEILGAEILLYQNVLKLSRDAFVVQLAPLADVARRLPLPDSIEGRLLAATVAHEVGHTLGLGHNFKASSAYDPDSVRSTVFLRRWGFTPSIMDYVRFNYVPQPEDHVPLDELIPRVGPYDELAIAWGYGSRERSATAARQQQTTQSYLRHSTLGALGSDPGEVTETVGDKDAIHAAQLGLANLRRSAAELPAIARQDQSDPLATLSALYTRLLTQWATLVGSVIPTIGGAESGDVGGVEQRFTPVSRQRQLAALDFVGREGLIVPAYLVSPAITRSVEAFGSAERVAQSQRRLLGQLLDNDRMARIAEYAALDAHEEHPLSLAEYVERLQDDVWAELRQPDAQIPLLRRLLQDSYVDLLEEKLTTPMPPTVNRQGQFGFRSSASLTAMGGVERAALRAAAVSLDRRIADVAGGVRDADARAHLESTRAWLRRILAR